MFRVVVLVGEHLALGSLALTIKIAQKPYHDRVFGPKKP